MASGLRVSNIMDNLSEKSANFLHAKRVIDTLTNFICSYDDCISSEHVPFQELTSVDSDGDRSNLEFFNSDAYKKVNKRRTDSQVSRVPPPPPPLAPSRGAHSRKNWRGYLCSGSDFCSVYV